MNKNIKIIIVLFFTILGMNCLHGQIWPFKDANGNIVRGKISGTVGDYRKCSTCNVPRFHAGVDMVSSISNVTDADQTDEDQAVYSMHEGIVTINQPNDYWNDYIRITLSDGTWVYYKHTLPNNYDPVANENVTQISTGDTVEVGDFLGLMIESTNQHVHINDNDRNNNNSSLTGNTNFINNFVSPFTDTHAPDFMFPFNSGDLIVDSNNGNDAVEFRRNGHRNNNPTAELNNTATIDDVQHKVIYEKVDIVSRIRDRHILASGGGSDNGNNGINRASFEVLDINNVSLGGVVENINFNDVPLNNRANYVFDNRSIIGGVSRHVYILTGNPHASDGVYDRFLNTRLRSGQTEDWDLNNRGDKDARSISEAFYKDGKYTLRLKANDISDQTGNGSNSTTRDANILIDNFKPFVKNVSVENYLGNSISNSGWSWDGSNYTFSEFIGAIDLLPNEFVRLIIETSEPMNDVVLEIDGLTDHSVSVVPNSNNKKWETYFYYSENISNGVYQLDISGTDLAMNEINPEPNTISIRQADGTWNPATPAGADRHHQIIFGQEGCFNSGGRMRRGSTDCLYADFSFETNGLNVAFTDLSSASTSITKWEWDFNDGSEHYIAYSEANKNPPNHLYPNVGTYYPTLIITSEGNATDSYTVGVEVLETVETEVNFTYNQIPGSKTVEFTDLSVGATSWEWTIEGTIYDEEANPTHTFENYGVHGVWLAINGDANKSIYKEINVQESNNGIIVNFKWSPETIYVNDLITFEYDISPPSNANIIGSTFNWYEKDNFGNWDMNVSHSNTAQFSFFEIGDHEIKMEVIQADQQTASIIKTISVVSKPDIYAKFSIVKNNDLPIGENEVYVGQCIYFQDETQDQSTITLRRWAYDLPEDFNFDEDYHPGLLDSYYPEFEDWQNIYFKYDTPGVYTVFFSVTDDSKNKHYTRRVTVLPSPNSNIPLRTEKRQFNEKTTGGVDMNDDYFAVPILTSEGEEHNEIILYSNYETAYAWTSANLITSNSADNIHEARVSNHLVAGFTHDPANPQMFIFSKNPSDSWLQQESEAHRVNEVYGLYDVDDNFIVVADQRANRPNENIKIFNYDFAEDNYNTSTIDLGAEIPTSVAIDGDYIAVGLENGTVNIYKRETITIPGDPVITYDSWRYEATLSSSGGDKIGNSVAIDGNSVVTSSVDLDGTAYVFENTLGDWGNMTQTATLSVFTDPNNPFDVHKKLSSVSISGQRIAVMADEDVIFETLGEVDCSGGGTSDSKGVVYVFEKTIAGGWQDQNEAFRLINSEQPYTWNTLKKSRAFVSGRYVVASDDYYQSPENNWGKLMSWELPLTPDYQCYSNFSIQANNLPSGNTALEVHGTINVGTQNNISSNVTINSGATLIMNSIKTNLNKFVAVPGSSVIIKAQKCEDLPGEISSSSWDNPN